jgi:hypothetical protein
LSSYLWLKSFLRIAFVAEFGFGWGVCACSEEGGIETSLRASWRGDCGAGRLRSLTRERRGFGMTMVIFARNNEELGVGFWFLGDDVDVDGGGIAEEAVDRGEVEVFAPVADGGAAEDDLGDVFAANEFGDGVGDATAF